MKNKNKVFLGIFSLLVLFSLLNVNSVAAQSIPMDINNNDAYQGRLQANNQYQFTFRFKTQLRLMANVNVDIDIECEALKIGVKDFALEVTTTHDLKMNMTCTEEQKELGLLAGYTYQIRNRNRLRYEERFCVQLKTNASDPLQAKLMIQATLQNQLGSWAYYDEAASEWVTVPTTVENGYLVATVDHFSYWTILIPDFTLAIVIGIGVGASILITVLAIYYKRKRN
jgi:hypothetical protein